MGAPVLALAGQIPSFAIDQGHGHLHELPDQLGLLRHITKYAARIRAPAGGAGAGGGGAACRHLRPDAAGGAGMRHRHLGRQPAAVSFPAPRPAEEAPVDAEAVARACAILERAERPLIVVGGGALDAGAELLALAERLEAPVASFRRGRGAIPTTHRSAVSFPEAPPRSGSTPTRCVAVGTRLYCASRAAGVSMPI